LAHYLKTNPAFKGIGPVKAERIAAHFGEDFDRALREYPKEICRVAGLSQQDIEILQSEWEKRKEFNALSTWLGKYELTHKQITRLIDENKKAVAVLFDSRTQMLELKRILRERGIDAKVSASENFYHTKEINDIFNVLKAAQILSKAPEKLDEKQRYFIAGALRSNILKVEDDRVKHYLEIQTVPETLRTYVNALMELPLGQAVKFIYDDANVMGAYAHLDDPEQRLANLYKFLRLCIEFEQGSETTLVHFLEIVENAIYFSESKEDEAFFTSEKTNAIELCTIHATKGLAYPMVLLANTHKSLYSQVTSESLKHNNFEMAGERKEIVGFKIGDYIPLSYRVLKELDKRKHLAEKKRLLYVALTRAKHHVILSALLNKKKDGEISLPDDSYLAMVASSLGIDTESLFDQTHPACIGITPTEPTPKKREVDYIDFAWKPLTFKRKQQRSATQTEGKATVDMEAAQTGTTVHRIIELYWQSFRGNEEAILEKMQVFDAKEREQIKMSMARFYESEVYEVLSQGAKHHFELEFNEGDMTGFIDLVYLDKARNGWLIVDFKTGEKTAEKEETYQKQLDFYAGVMKRSGVDVVEMRLLWL